MMSAKMFFRLMVALSLAVALAIVGTVVWPPAWPDEWAAVLEWHGNGGIFDDVFGESYENTLAWMGLALVIVVAAVIALAVEVGMFLFWRPARAGYAALIVVYLLFVAFDGLVVMTPIEAALYNVTLLLDGSIVAMSYLPPIAAYFEHRVA